MFARNIMVIEPSRSLQKGRRFISKSEFSEVIFTFSDGKHHSGKNAIEMMFFNGKRGQFELAEINFDSGNLTISVIENPIILELKINGINNKSILRELEKITRKTEKYPFIESNVVSLVLL